jgi:hypothetical protein
LQKKKNSSSSDSGPGSCSYSDSSSTSEEQALSAADEALKAQVLFLLFVVDKQVVAAITDMGFSVTAAERAWWETRK